MIFACISSVMTKPIDSLKELWALNLADSGRVSYPLLNYGRDKFANNEAEVMICHDMKGGYLPEERDEGCDLVSSAAPYVFLNWWNIDLFCYFSHHFVTVPPAGYIKTAHEHGCLVMGTFITEWDDGKAICAEVLESEDSIRMTVSRLVELAVQYNFEGWLINIENEIKPNQISNLVMFLCLLTNSMRAAVPHSRVIWYDSVTKSGKLRWQNELNDENRLFYDSCDGIYLNYNWNDQMLLDSADFGTLSRIFVGIDCFARGCVGGWDCYKSFEMIKLLRMSVALFAPGWIAESYPNEDPVVMGLKFWKKLAGLIPERPITCLPFETTLCTGISNGQYCLLNVHPQPHHLRSSYIFKNNQIVLHGGVEKILNLDVSPIDSRVQVEVVSSKPIIIHINNQCLETNELHVNKYSALCFVSHIASVSLETAHNDTVVSSIAITE